MQYGHTEILACPACGFLYRKKNLLSGNTFKGTLWTDGFAAYPMLRRLPNVTRCFRCGAIFWVSDASIVGMIPNAIERMLANALHSNSHSAVSDEAKEGWEKATELTDLNERDCYEAIHSGKADTPERERQLRMLAWHEANQPYRYRGSDSEMNDGAVASAEGRLRDKVEFPRRNPLLRHKEVLDNLERLLELLDQSVAQERLLKAELLRELERYDESLQLLSSSFPEELQFVVEFIRKLAERHDPVVRQIQL